MWVQITAALKTNEDRAGVPQNLKFLDRSKAFITLNNAIERITENVRLCILLDAKEASGRNATPASGHEDQRSQLDDLERQAELVDEQLSGKCAPTQWDNSLGKEKLQEIGSFQ